MSQHDYDDDDPEGRQPGFHSNDSGVANKAAHDISSRKLNEYLFKIVRYRHMDFELARFIMIKSILSPKQLYLHTKRSKQIKNQWHRDDPCLTSVNILFLALCALLVCLSAPKGISLGSLILEWLITCICFTVFHFVLWGVVMAAITRFVAQTYLKAEERNQIHSPATGHLVEPMYAFDIHCNGFFPVILFFYFGNVSSPPFSLTFFDFRL